MTIEDPTGRPWMGGPVRAVIVRNRKRRRRSHTCYRIRWGITQVIDRAVQTMANLLLIGDEATVTLIVVTVSITRCPDQMPRPVP